MNKEYMKPEMDITVFDTEDVITTSSEDGVEQSGYEID